MTPRKLQIGLVLAAVATAGALVVASLAAGSGPGDRKTYRFSETAWQATVKQSPDWPAVGSSNATAAVILARSTEVGNPGNTFVHRGAYRHYNTITGQPTPTTLSLKGTGQSYFGDGSAKVKYHGTVTPNPDGSVGVAGAGRIVGGTGDREGASGRFSFKASAPSPTSPYTVHLKGTFTY